LNKGQKTQIVDAVKDKFQKAQGVVMTEYKGLSVKDVNELRDKLRTVSCEYKVIKNTLAEVAIKDMGIDDIKSFLNGPTAIIFEYQDPVAPAKIMYDFQKEHEKFKIKAGLLGKKILNAAEIKQLASLPDRETLLAMVLSRMQSPIAGLVNVLHGTLRNMVYVLDAIGKQKQKA
jgi:large subunit ribosomal protein L10